MHHEGRALPRWAPLALFVVLTLASLRPIRSYDYFWHLATGKWIVEHRALPQSDPFAVASDAQAWVNGEWLFELILFPLFDILGHGGVSVLRAMGLALIFAVAFAYGTRYVTWQLSLAIALACWYGCLDRFDARPASAAVVILTVALWMLLELPPGWRRAAGYSLITALWINVHPSALIAPALAGALVMGNLSANRPRALRRPLVWDLATLAGSAAALLLNPYGLHGVAAPLHLVGAIRSGKFVNAEWLASDPRAFPLLYVALIFGGAALLINREKETSSWLARTLIFSMLGVLAVRYVRNQSLFFSAVPWLIWPFVAGHAVSTVRGLLPVASALIMVAAVVRDGHGTGVDADLFPVRAIEQLRASGLQGNIFNADQFGGALIWAFYPSRRVVTDGRNELYDVFLKEYGEAREDSRKWQRLLDKYRITLAVEEYHRQGIETVDFATGRRRMIAPSMAFFPRSKWALIGFDDVGMVFARRSEFSRQVLQPLEFGLLRPDDIAAMQSLGPLEMQRLREEIVRAREMVPGSVMVEQLQRIADGSRR